MITEEKLEIYLYYKGNIDAWARTKKSSHKINMKDEDWKVIDDFIQNIWLVYKGLTSEDFKMNVERKLTQYCDNVDTINRLKEIADD